METMGKLMQMKVLISGLRGLGVEVAKNLILAGPAQVILHDEAPAELRDLGANFYLTQEDDPFDPSRAEACRAQLAELNPYVAVELHRGPITEQLVQQVSLMVLTETPQSELVRLNKLCRSAPNPVGFIAADCLGLASFVFVDYGDAFMCHDKDGEEPRSAIVSGVTLESPGTVHTHQDRRHGFQDGDSVVFKEVQGMTQLNDGKPRQIKVTGPYSFTIDEDTSKYSAYISDGIVTQTKVPHHIPFFSYEQSLAQPRHPGEEMHVPDMAKFGRSEQLHFAVQAVLAYREKHGELPAVRDAAAAKECVDLAKQINEARKKGGNPQLFVEELEEEIVTKVAMFARCMICPMAAFLGGVVAQEVVKFTGKFSPIHQFLYFDMFELCPATEPDWKPKGCRYDDQIAILGSSFQEALANMKLFLVGAGALGCEFLKSFAMMGVGCAGKITVTDMDRIEISNLNRQSLWICRSTGSRLGYLRSVPTLSPS
ncbi:Ubiquitin-like modifier-activating enzyme 1 (Ubiquitin-activating enzyme E1) [Durusdinium trenchii]|uniref:Ubiquitin-like modifier-activating enzyme 1 (Ubiquitin-activating enzyme E1) n=1 Tax=Durusdinium trenchii TaxID=1381693 RepID=A0ABP0PLB4_9DINO